MSIMGFLNILVRSSINSFCLKDMDKIPDEVLGTLLTSKKKVLRKAPARGYQ